MTVDPGATRVLREDGARPIEPHGRAEGVHWEELGDDHLHQLPRPNLAPPEADNLLAIGRCIDADPLARSSVRVTAPASP